MNLGENDLTITKGAINIENAVLVETSTPTGLAGSLVPGSTFGSEEESLLFYLSVYSYKIYELTKVYSTVSSEIYIGASDYSYKDISFSFNPVAGVDGYNVKVRYDYGIYYYDTASTSGTLPTNGTNVIAPVYFSPYTVKAEALNINGVANIDDTDFDGRLKLYDGSTYASVIGDTTGDTRGTYAIDISTKRVASTNVASGQNSILIGQGTASGSSAVCFGTGYLSTSSGINSVLIGSGTSSGSSSFAVNGTASTNNDTTLGGVSSGGFCFSTSGATASGSAAVALGQQARATNTGCFALSFYSEASGQYTTSIGRGVRSSGDGTTAIGYNFTDNTPNAICFGTGVSGSLEGNTTLLRIRDAEGAEMYRPLQLSVNGSAGGGYFGANVLKNGTFSSSTYWTLSAGWTVFIGKLRATTISSDLNVAKSTNANLNTPIIAGNTYEITYTVSSYSFGGVRAHIGGAYSTLRTGDGTYTENVVALTSNLDFWFERQAGTSTTLRIDDVTVRQVLVAHLNIEGSVLPLTNDFSALGTGTKSFSDLFLASGGVINFNNGDVTLTHSAGKLTQNTPFEATTLKATTAGGFVSSDGSTGFTGTGAYTNFTIKDGIIINAS